MTQLWTIVESATGKVVCPRFPTADADQHPSAAGWNWNEETQIAVMIGTEPNPAVEVFDPDAGTWIANLPVLRARRWDAVKGRRDQAEWAGCATALGRVDTDPDSQRKAGGAVQMAMIAQAAGATFALDWTMQDNSTVTHDASAMIAMGVAIGQHVAACHEVALAKRGAIDAAATADDIAAVGLDDGWPA